jgi:nicotinate-nucleotide pyrophosphorylase (carboxylating)
VLIKENHISAAGGVGAAIRSLRQAGVKVPIEVEVEHLHQIEDAIGAGADMLLLDNFELETMTEAVRLAAGRLPLEASGGFSLEDLREVAATGVDYISSGALTKHVRAVDLSMQMGTAP